MTLNLLNTAAGFTGTAHTDGRGVFSAVKAFSLTPGDYVGTKYGVGAASHGALRAELGKRSDMIEQNRGWFTSAPMIGPNNEPIPNAMYTDSRGRIRVTDSKGFRTQVNTRLYKELAEKMRRRREEADEWINEFIDSEEAWTDIIGDTSTVGANKWPSGMKEMAKLHGWLSQYDSLTPYNASWAACNFGGTDDASKGKLAMNLRKAQFILMCNPPDEIDLPIQEHRGLLDGKNVTYDVDPASAAAALATDMGVTVKRVANPAPSAGGQDMW
jgi:hypothetical protein